MLFLFFFTIDLYFLIPAITAQMFNPTAELIIPTGISTNEGNAEIETQPVTVKARIQHNLNIYMSSYTFNSLNHCVLFRLKDNLLFHQFFLNPDLLLLSYLSLKYLCITLSFFL